MRELKHDSLITMKDMTEDSGFTAKYFYSQIKGGRLPEPTKFGHHSRWLYSDYQDWKSSYFPSLKKAS
ncbi:AlpA family transcriptional regulator [Serratia sp. M24T3]|nr:AlpA family transcriptional regulator [Serratia sp. M24T3]